MTHPIFLFAADHPYITFFLSWPVALVLIAVSWSIAGTISAAITSTVTLISSLINAVVITCKGYPPAPLPPEDNEDGESI